MEPEGDAKLPDSDGVDPGQLQGVDAETSQPVVTNKVPVAARPGSTRTSRAWLGSVFGLVVLIAILIFILQNLASVSIHFPAATVKMPIGVAILFGVILGGLFVFLLGLARVVQLRHSMRRNRRLG
jgi:uncharacterized integral membrane protein